MNEPRRRVLLVAGEHVRMELRRELRTEPYELVEAGGPAAALELLARRRVDVIVADHALPGPTGLELLAIAGARWPGTVRIVLTDQAEMRAAVEAINRGELFRFLTKPWDEIEMKLALVEACERLDRDEEDRSAKVHRFEALPVGSRRNSATSGADPQGTGGPKCVLIDRHPQVG